MKRTCLIALILTLLMLLAALAEDVPLIAKQLYRDAPAPQDVLDSIQYHADSVAATDLCELRIEETLYDGFHLHLAWTVSNPTDTPLLYTVERIALNGTPINMAELGNIYPEGPGSAGLLLGGSVEGIPLPVSRTLYNGGTYVAERFAPSAEDMLTFRLAVWRPINPPILLDYTDYEGRQLPLKQVKQLMPDQDGYCDLLDFRPEAYTQPESTAAAYANAYRDLGWADFLDYLELTVPVDLRSAALVRLTPAAAEYALSDCRMVIKTFTLSHAGGDCELAFFGAEKAVRTRGKHPLYLVDLEHGQVLSDSCIWDYQRSLAEEGLCYHLSMPAFSGDLPTRLYLAPQIAYNDAWNATTRAYDPAVSRPAGVIGSQQFDLSQAVILELIPQ